MDGSLGRQLDFIKMTSSLLPLLVVFGIFTSFASGLSFRRTAHDSDHHFAVLRLDRRNNQTTSNTTLAELYACKLTREYVLQAAKANCSTYIEPLELVASFPPWEQYEAASSFANCTYHQIATRFPDMPDGVPTLVFRGGTLVFTPRPNMSDARNFLPPPPIKRPLDQDKAAPFLPVLRILRTAVTG